VSAGLTPGQQGAVT